MIKIKQRFLFPFFLCLFWFGQAHAIDNTFSVRDSRTGVAVDAKVTVLLTENQSINDLMWRQIKLGQEIPNHQFSTSIEIHPKDKRFTLESNDSLQYITIEAEGYQTLRTYIEAHSKIQMNAVMLDSKQSQPLCDETVICGFIYDKQSLKPLNNVTLELSNYSSSQKHSTTGSGYFEINSGQLKGAELRIHRKGYQSHLLYNMIENTGFNLVIDLEPGYGLTQQSMRHPIESILSQSVDKQWLKDKLSHDESTPNPLLQERGTGAVYLEPPGSIRVGFNGSGGTCCGAGCSTSQVYSLETYVQKGLDNEWIASWDLDSLKAGSIPFRSYGAWHVMNQVYSGYDICAGPCCQAFESVEYPASVTAAAATHGIMLDSGGNLARSEYSAQNNSWDDPNDGLNCSNSDLSCGDGFVGSPDTGWTCLSDNVSIGRGCFGHGRGMSQWGTQFHAQNGVSFADIVDHYYNASNNPSGQRSQYASTPIRLDAIVTQQTTTSPNEVFMIDYQLFNATTGNMPFGPILLGASLVNQNNSYSDTSNDLSINLTSAGSDSVSRHFQTPEDTAAGVYDLQTSIYLDVDGDHSITATDWKLVTLSLGHHMTVLNENDLIFKHSF